MITEKQELIALVLKDNLLALNKAKDVLLRSIDRCGDLIDCNNDDEDSLESCEALSSRFARAADILTQKVLINIFLLLREKPISFIDKCHLAEKLGIIKNAEVLIEIRDMRNEVAHEYRITDMTAFFKQAHEYAKKLVVLIDEVNAYIIEKNFVVCME